MKRDIDEYPEWKKAKADVFWGEIAPCDHVLQIYENNGVFLDALAGFVGGGINSGDSSIVIATDVHLKSLEDRLESYGIQTRDLISEKRYFPISAAGMLDRFMVNGWPDENLFMEAVTEVLEKASGGGKRKVRAFGEMVALLWAEGNNGATVHLEHLWDKFCHQVAFCLFCAYPKVGFTQEMTNSLEKICSAHSKMIAGSAKQLTEVYYKESPAA